MQCEVEIRNYDEIKTAVYKNFESAPVAADSIILGDFKRGVIEEYAAISNEVKHKKFLLTDIYLLTNVDVLENFSSRNSNRIAE